MLFIGVPTYSIDIPSRRRANVKGEVAAQMPRDVPATVQCSRACASQLATHVKMQVLWSFYMY